MSKSLLIAATMALSCTWIPNIAQAAAPTTADPAQASKSVDISKDAWLDSMMPMLPNLICKGFLQDEGLKKRFDEIKMTFEQCVSLIPASAKICKEQIYSTIPEKINSDSAGIWGRKLGECIGKDFAEKYLIPKKS